MQKPGFNTSAIMLRRINIGDYDLIVTFLSETHGKIATLARYARKSSRRFAGVLELFSACHLVCAPGRNPELPILKEASLENPFASIRSSILKTAYASLWVELADIWLDRNSPQSALYGLLHQVLKALDQNSAQPEILSMLYLMHFLNLAGLHPLFSACTICGCCLESLSSARLLFNSRRGGIICSGCNDRNTATGILIPRGVIRPLLWLGRTDPAKAGRMRLTPQITLEALNLLETFVTDHLGRMPRSLPVLKNIRKAGRAGACQPTWENHHDTN